MTEVKWLACSDPLVMLNHLHREAGHWSRSATQSARWDRRVVRWLRATLRPNDQWSQPVLYRRLYLAACGMKRLCHPVIIQDWSPQLGLEVEERFADGGLTLDALLADNLERQWWWSNPWHLVSHVIRSTWGTNATEFWPIQCQVLRDVFAVAPSRPAAANPVWLTPTVIALARQMYESRDFGAMPILADALQDAGCADVGVLSHCRGPGPHVRGCWVVDLVLGKA